MESKTIKIVALVAFGVSMFVLGRVTDCGSNCGLEKTCEKQIELRSGESGIANIDIEALVGEHFEGDTIIIMNDKDGHFSKEIRIEKYIEIGEDDHDSEYKH